MGYGSKNGLVLLVITLVVSELVAILSSHRLPQIPVVYAGVIHTQRSDDESLSLTLGGSIKREISEGKVHSYRIVLNSGQYLRLTVDQWGIDVGVALYGPSNLLLTKLRCRLNEPTPVSLIAQETGVYRLEMQSLEKAPSLGRYEVKVEEIRQAVANDEHSIAAEMAFAEGESLRLGWEAESRPQAIKKYEEALRYWKTSGDQQEEINALNQIAELRYQSGEPQKALESYRQALLLSQTINDRRRKGETLNGICYVTLYTGDQQKASEECAQALSLNQVAGNQRGEAQALNNLGKFYSSRSNLQKALDCYHLALTLWRTLGDQRGEAQVLMYFGYVYSDLREIQKAFDFYKQALSLWRAVNDYRGQALTLTAIGHHYSELGEQQEALKVYHQAMQLFQIIGDLLEKGQVLSGMGYVYGELGEKRKALQYRNQALRLYQARGRRILEATTFMVIGEAHYSLGEYQKAIDHYQQALSIARSLDQQRIESYVLRDIGLVYESLGNKTKALEYLERALLLNQVERDRRWEAYTLNDTARIYEMMGEKQKALDNYYRALPLNWAVEDHVGESLTLYNIAHVERDRGSLAEARSQVEASLNLIESLRTKVASQDLRSSYFASVRQRYDFYVDLLMQQHKQHPAEGLDVAAFQASERARARSMLELLAEAHTDIQQGADPGLLERERSLQQLISDKTEHRIRLLGSNNTKDTEAEAAAIARELQDLITKYDEVKDQIKAQSPRYTSLTQPQPLSLPEIQQQVLAADTLLLEYALGDERSYLWAVTPDSITSYELPKRAQIEAAASRVSDLLRARNQHPKNETPAQWQLRVKRAEIAYPSAATNLSRMILGPVAAQLGSKRLLIVSEGGLQYLPFGALPVPEKEGERRKATGKSVSSASPTFLPLVVEHEIVSLPSASTLAVLRRELAGRKPAPKAIAVLADPVFASDDERIHIDGQQPVAKASSKESPSGGQAALPLPSTDLERAIKEMGRAGDRGAISRLPFSRQEAEEILKLVPADEALRAIDFQASQETVTSAALSQYRIIHFATHGWLPREHPELAGIVLSLVDEQGQPKKGFLQLQEIYNLKLPAELVVLSACETGLGKEIKGEGLVGLTRGFMYAGAARVVASLWNVNDAATAELMKHFYQGMLKEGLTPAAALRAAQVAMWKQKAWQSPYYWAAFVLQGEWQ